MFSLLFLKNKQFLASKFAFEFFCSLVVFIRMNMMMMKSY